MRDVMPPLLYQEYDSESDDDSVDKYMPPLKHRIHDDDSDNTLVGNDVGTTLGTTSVGDSESTFIGQHTTNNPVGDDEGTTLGTSLVGASESTILGANNTVIPMGVVVGTTLGTTLVGASESITLGENCINTVGSDVGTNLGSILVGASEGTTLGENYNSNSVGAHVGSTLGTTSMDNSEIPTRHEIMETSTFGKTSKDHSFTSEACFEHTLIFILKSGFLADTEQKNLLECHTLFNHLHKMMTWSKTLNFSSIKNPIDNYSQQKNIDPERVKQFLASALHFDLDMATVIRFLGGNYTGEYRDTKRTIKALKDTNCDKQIIKDIERTLLVGCPNKMNSSSTHENFMKYFRYGNHTSIAKNLEKTSKTLNKEDKNQYVLPFPVWLARFIKNLHLTPQGLVCSDGKNDRLIWDGSFIPDWDAICINMMLNQADEPEIIYGSCFTRYLTQIWNTRISFPDDEIYLFDDDVKGAFRHSKYHPDIASAFSFIIGSLLFIPMGGTFGSVVSPSDFEPFARARVHLAEALSNRRDLLAKHKDIIDKVKFSEDPTSDTIFVKASPDKFNKGLKHMHKTVYSMFVDDSLFAQVSDNIKHAMAASIEALYIVLGYPETEIRQSPLSLDKYFQSVCSYQRVQLGKTVDSRKMSVGLSKDKRLAMIGELSHWHIKRRSFILLEGVILCGSLEFWASTSPWARFLYLALRTSVNKALFNCSKITNNKKEIKKMITDVANAKNTNSHQLKEKFIKSKIAKEIYNCQHKAFITKTMKSELKIMQHILSHPKKYSLETPIAHLIEKEPDFITYGDACLEAGGGFQQDVFWWHVEWPEAIKRLTLKRLMVTKKCPITDKLISINLLEFLVEIINYAAITVLFQTHPELCKHSFPTLLNWTDNTTSKSWIKKAATKTIKGKALQRILCLIMINNPVGITVEHIAGINNILADAISRVYSQNNSTLSFKKLMQEFPMMKSWNRFLPSQELLSALYSGLLEGREPGLCLPKTLGHFTQDRNIL